VDIAEEPIRSLSPDEREKLHNYLTDLRDHFEHYHERKENMSWAATTVYLGSIATLVGWKLNSAMKDLPAVAGHDSVTHLLR